MNVRNFALIFGVVFVAIAVSGFIPGLNQHADHPGLSINEGSGNVFGLFPVNIVHNLVHLLFGIWGLAASRSLDASRGYAKALGIIYAVLAIMGLIPGLDTMFGLAPLFGNDVWLHALLAAAGIYFGWFHRDRVADAR
jgi:hypothetical protein